MGSVGSSSRGEGGSITTTTRALPADILEIDSLLGSMVGTCILTDLPFAFCLGVDLDLWLMEGLLSGGLLEAQANCGRWQMQRFNSLDVSLEFESQ